MTWIYGIGEVETSKLIEKIRHACHADDATLIEGDEDVIIGALSDWQDRTIAHYFAANKTTAVRDRLLDAMMSRMELISKHDFSTWRIDIPNAHGSQITACLPHHLTDAAWMEWATRDVLKWGWCACLNDIFDEHHQDMWDSVEELWRIVEAGDILEAQKQRSRVSVSAEFDDSEYTRANWAKNRVFAEAILEMWTGVKMPRVYEPGMSMATGGK